MNKGLVFSAAVAFSLALASCDSTTSPTRPLNRAQLKAAGLQMVVSIGWPKAGTVHFEIGVENVGSEEVTLGFVDGQFFEIEVADQSGNLVWRWSHDKAFTDALWSLKLGPGESYKQDTDWDLTGNDGKPLAPGAYKARFIITSSPRDESLAYETALTI